MVPFGYVLGALRIWLNFFSVGVDQVGLTSHAKALKVVLCYFLDINLLGT